MPTPSPVNHRNPKTPWDFIEVQRRELIALDDDALTSLETSYRAASRKAFAELERVTKQIARALENGEPVHPNWLWRQQRWSALLIQMGESMAQFGVQAADTIDRVGILAGYMGGDHAATRMKAAGPHISFQQLPQEALDMMIAQLRLRAPTGALLRSISQDAKNTTQSAMINAIRTELTNGIAVGRNPRDVAKSIYNKVKNDVDTVTYRRAENIARTESMRAYRGAQTANYRENDDVVEGWVWVAALNMFTCAACLARHMTTHPLSEEMQSHPSCRCTAMPFVDNEKPDLPYGDEWLKQQPESVQKHIMRSPTRYELWKDGKITLADCATEKNNPTWGRSVNVTTIGKLNRIASGELPSTPNTVWNPYGDPVSIIKPTPTKTAPNAVTVDTLPRRARIANSAPDPIDPAIDAALGFDVMDWATGLAPEGDSITVRARKTISHIELSAHRQGGVNAQRTFFPDQGIVSHDSMYTHADVRGQGVRIFAAQVQTYRGASYKKIKTLAARSANVYNGYYTWARFGFDGPLTSRYWTDLLRGTPFEGARKLSDLMVTPDGREWWKDHGQTIELEFDLTDGSYSMRVLEEYIAERQNKGNFAWSFAWFARRRKPKTPKFEHPPRLTREESDTLDRVLDRLAWQ